ncbi:hypothetical protein L9F63_007592, partial [Diploptera punctata]
REIFFVKEHIVANTSFMSYAQMKVFTRKDSSVRYFSSSATPSADYQSIKDLFPENLSAVSD